MRGLSAQPYGTDTPPPMSTPGLGPPTPHQPGANVYGSMFGPPGVGTGFAPQQQAQAAQQQQQEEVKIYALVIDLMDVNTRESALLELSKKREQYDDLALVLWHSFGKLPI